MRSGDLAELPLHVVVRDYPETLAVLRGRGVSVREQGGRPLMEVEEDAPGVLEALDGATAWRREGPGGDLS